jgi:hypothetical protein
VTIPIRRLHILLNPPDDAVVAVIRGYFDNSGDANDPQHNVLTLGAIWPTKGSGRNLRASGRQI